MSVSLSNSAAVPDYPAPALNVHPDRLFPSEPGLRDLARRLYGLVSDHPIISPHGHVDPQILVDDRPFADPTSLLVQPDHYVTRLLYAVGVPLSSLGVGRGPLPEPEARQAWRLLCANWPAFRGTPVRYWFDAELSDIFGVTERPCADNADRLYDEVADRLARPEYRPRRLLESFKISVLATTDDPCDDLSPHAVMAADPEFPTRVIPTFRPDRYLEAAGADWPDLVDKLGMAAEIATDSYPGYIAALESRRRYFVARGAVSADHSHRDLETTPLDPSEASRIFGAARRGEATVAETTAFRRHMMSEMARMSCDDGLVMTVHPGVSRNHHSPTFSEFGSDTGHDIPVATEYTTALRPLLQRYGTHPNFHLVLFTVDADTFSREIAPLAGFYPSVFVGAPWWFLDNPTEIRAFQRSATETAGFSKLSGFIDDTRAFCSIPSRHDMSRRLDAGFLAELVAQHRLDLDEAEETIVQLVDRQPRKVFKL